MGILRGICWSVAHSFAHREHSFMGIARHLTESSHSHRVGASWMSTRPMTCPAPLCRTPVQAGPCSNRSTLVESAMTSRRKAPSMTISVATVLIIITDFGGRHGARAQVRLPFPQCHLHSLFIFSTRVAPRQARLTAVTLRNHGRSQLQLFAHLTRPAHGLNFW